MGVETREVVGLPAALIFFPISRIHGILALSCQKYSLQERDFTMNTNELMSMVESLPIDIKTQLIEKLLSSLNPAQKEIDALWAAEAEKRVTEMREGKVKAIPGDEVFKEIRERLNK
jgi:putative addiction module component (TIGR02574 family)